MENETNQQHNIMYICVGDVFVGLCCYNVSILCWVKNTHRLFCVLYKYLLYMILDLQNKFHVLLCH